MGDVRGTGDMMTIAKAGAPVSPRGSPPKLEVLLCRAMICAREGGRERLTGEDFQIFGEKTC